jgi:hypothetical protein
MPLQVKIGDKVCDCRFEHLRILKIWDDGDTVTLEDGANCSISHCLDEVDHDWPHPHNY